MTIKKETKKKKKIGYTRRHEQMGGLDKAEKGKKGQRQRLVPRIRRKGRGRDRDG